MISQRTIISRSAGLIFAIFSPNESVLGADERFGPLFPISQGTLPGSHGNLAAGTTRTKLFELNRSATEWWCLM